MEKEEQEIPGCGCWDLTNERDVTPVLKRQGVAVAGIDFVKLNDFHSLPPICPS